MESSKTTIMKSVLEYKELRFGGGNFSTEREKTEVLLNDNNQTKTSIVIYEDQRSSYLGGEKILIQE